MRVVYTVFTTVFTVFTYEGVYTVFTLFTYEGVYHRRRVRKDFTWAHIVYI